jgi:glycosyltransferase involved in cell wall biosynthesis
MHILIIPSEHYITSWSPLGGIFQRDLARALRDSKLQVGIISVGKFPGFKLFRDWKYIEFEYNEEIPIFRHFIECPIPYRYDYLFLLSQLFSKKVNDLYDKYVNQFGKPDVIHAHNLRYAGCVAANLSLRHGIPFVVTEHSSAYSAGEIRGKVANKLASVARQAQCISAVSGPFATVISNTLQLGEKNINVIPNFLPEEFQNKFIPKISRQETEDFIFLNVAELVPIKNHALLLEAFAIGFRQTNARLRIAGGGQLKLELLSYAKELGILGQVDFLGRLSREDVREQMQLADCFVFSSNSETFGVVLIEALSQGLPVVSTSCGGPSDIVNEQNGVLAIAGDVKSLSSMMIHMRNKCKHFDSESISDECMKLYGKNTLVKHYIEFYRNAINQFKTLT